MTARETLEYLYNIGMTQHYMKPITLFKNLQPIPHYKYPASLTTGSTTIPFPTPPISSLPAFGSPSTRTNACPKYATMSRRAGSRGKAT